MAPEPTQNRIGSTHCNPRQAIESVISSVRAAVDCDSHLARKALIEPVRDTGHSEIIHMHYQGTQLFEKGLGFPSRTARGWEDMHLREQVRTENLGKQLKLDVTKLFHSIHISSHITYSAIQNYQKTPQILLGSFQKTLLFCLFDHRKILHAIIRAMNYDYMFITEAGWIYDV